MRILIILAALGVIIVCASVGSAQTKKTPKVGGYKTVSVEDAKVIEAADFAVATQAEKDQVIIELASIEKAEIQTVAGTNYRVCMQIIAYGNDSESEDGEDAEGMTAFVKVIVFQSLKGELSLTSWIVLENCGK